MIERKPLIWFFIIAFVISWILFLTPLVLINTSTGATQAQVIYTIFFALAMWGPGIGAIVATLFIAKQPFSTLRLNTLGPKRFYIWAWLLPPVLSLLGLGATILFGTAQLDTNFTFLREQMAQSPQAQAIPVEVIVLIQILQGFLVGPLINIIFAMGEELGWRGFLLPRLMPLGQWKAVLLTGAIWGFWHTPAIMQGHNYPDHPYIGVILMIIFCILLGVIFGWLYLNTKSPWVAALAHGSFNAWAGLPILFLKQGYDTALGGILTSVSGWAVLILVIGLLIWTRRFPVPMVLEKETDSNI